MKASSGVTGVNELQLRLTALPGALSQSILRRAVRQGANVIAAKGRANFTEAVAAIGAARSDTLNPHTLSGALRASIRVVERRGTPTRVVFNVVAGSLSGAQKKKFGADAAYYALWVERGHINRKVNQALRGGARLKQHYRMTSTSNTPAHPFLRPAVDSESSLVIQTISSSVIQQLGEL